MLDNNTNSDQIAAAPQTETVEQIEPQSVETNETNNTTPACDTELDAMSKVDNLEPDAKVSDTIEMPKAKPAMSKFEKKKRFKNIISTICSIVIWIVGICLFLLCASNLYQQTFNPSGYTGFFGIGEAVVASNSMEPELYANDLIFYREVDPEEVAVNDIIVYEKTSFSGESILIVHQVIDVGNGYVTTQGINNAVPDESFPVSAVVGKYMFKIGQLGVILNALATPMAPLLIILLLIAIFALRIALYYMHKKKVIENISTKTNTRDALDHFFDI